MGLRGQPRIEYERKMIVQRGGIPSPKPKIPYKIMQGMIKKRKQREDRVIKQAFQTKNAEEQGIKPPQRTLTTTQKKQRKRNERISDAGVRGLSISTGKYSHGILKIRKETLEEGTKENTINKKKIINEKMKRFGKTKGKRKRGWK
ncbi:MAG: hypothetical protein EZS28_007929 [Streblomastix strix]|uniref:Uncharacterized protein n=1 Tax=Streblomastix strix TaxID=222440 RepID=A0A5J4WQ73_9EUKA|nr:MAG: hypothetical protein EZS28_007929 [Streblomastix strix]